MPADTRGKAVGLRQGHLTQVGTGQLDTNVYVWGKGCPSVMALSPTHSGGADEILDYQEVVHVFALKPAFQPRKKQCGGGSCSRLVRNDHHARLQPFIEFSKVRMSSAITAGSVP